MPGDDLTPSESAILIVLMAEARELSNPELRQRYGIDVSRPTRDKLNRLGYVDSRQGARRTWLHQLADEGWVRVERDLDFTSPRARALGGALVALHTVLRDRIMPRADSRTLGELFTRSDLRAAPGGHDRQRVLRTRLRQAYAALAGEPGDLVGLATLRPFFADVERAELDEALRALAREPNVIVVPESNQKMLTADQSAAALHVGGQDKHLLAIGSS
ncbi:MULTISPECIES: hypothetical protein [Micromonospora]|uniref:Uncharacterized protein n=1 Tax=Micromonospora yangpuensis TaxID=683228 RepID=A0A1C6V2T8_9ACTN|nr:hypothetical protein [Micromonospora yangpuensis]GGM14672.1 hypothetical protein GCM10012279_35990 [Micromonospora yangpuensis]SCL60679.1 hypothetical protein GA0070617_4445 [Micromonospora yangpuensis]